MTRIVLALGSNVGDSRSNIDKAVELLAASIDDIVRAPLYSSRAVGYVDQPDFVNTAIAGNTTLTPQSLLNFVKGIEHEIGRVHRFRWGPREIDIDIILYGDKIVEESNLTIPHERFRERDFVLRPLADIAPDAIDPVSGVPVAVLLDAIPSSGLSVINRET